MDSVLARNKNVFFVTNYQALLWITNPTDVNNIPAFEEWKDKCKVELASCLFVPIVAFYFNDVPHDFFIAVMKSSGTCSRVSFD